MVSPEPMLNLIAVPDGEMLEAVTDVVPSRKIEVLPARNLPLGTGVGVGVAVGASLT